MSIKNLLMSKDFIHIIERIKEIKKLPSEAAVAKELGLSKENLYGYKNRGKIPLSAILLFCEREGISPTYLLWGENKVPSREKLKIKYGYPFPEDDQRRMDENQSIIKDVIKILDTKDIEIIQSLRDRVENYKAILKKKKESEERLVRIEEALARIDPQGWPGGPGRTPEVAESGEPGTKTKAI